MNNKQRIIGRRGQRGQGMTEYIIIVALIAIAAITVFSFFGKTVRNQVGGVASELAGKKAGPAIQKAQTAADNAIKEGDKDKGMGEYKNDQVAK